MSNKTLKIRRVFVYSIYNKLRNTPPKDYPTTGEIKSTISVILPALKEQSSTYLEILGKAEDLSIKVAEKKVTEEEAQKMVNEYNEEFRNYGKEKGNEIVEISLDEEAFKVLKSQFDRENWGKNWVMNVEEFGELLTAFAEAEK